MEYKAQIQWKRTNSFNPKSFDRTHQIQFGSGLSFEASSAPEFLGKADLPNPEELFTASISSCYMLTFLYWAAASGLVVDQYQDNAVGILSKNSEGKLAMTEVHLNPKISFQDDKSPDSTVLQSLLEKAHQNCFISNSVKTKIVTR